MVRWSNWNVAYMPQDSRARGSIPSRTGCAANRGTLQYRYAAIADLFPQRVPIDSENLGGTDLVARGSGECGANQRLLHFCKDPVVQSRRRKRVAIAGEVLGEIAVEEVTQSGTVASRSGLTCRAPFREL